MKQFIKSILLIAVTVAAVSCAKEMADVEYAGSGQSELTVSLPDACKTSIGDKESSSYPLKWSTGDVIYANGVASKPLTSSRAGSATATFSFPNPVSAPYNITYAGKEGADDIVTIPSTQVTTVPQYYKTSYTPTFKDGVEPMYAYSEDGTDVTFHHLGVVLRIPVIGDSDSRQIRHILVSSDAGEAIGGTFKIGKTSGKLDGSLSSAGGTSSVSLTCTTGFTTLSTAGSRIYVVVVAPGTYSKGITASVVASDGSVMYLHSFTGETLEAGKVYEYPETTFAADDKYDITIQNEGQLAAFYTKLEEGQKCLSAVIVKDITVKTPSSTWPESVNKFSGCIEGGGHTIAGLTCPMFNELDGTVKNLVLNSTITETMPVKDTNWTGILARRMYLGGFVKNCTVKGSLTLSHTADSSITVGGIVGYIVRGCVTGCTNEADISLDAGDNAKNVFFGGLVGRAYASADVVTISDNINKGDITLTGSPQTVALGGVMGYNSLVLTENSVENCTNFGNVTLNINTDASDESQAGGVIGRSDVKLINSANYGTVTVNGTYNGLVCAGGVVGRIYQTSVTDARNYGKVTLPAECSLLKQDSFVGGVVGFASNKNYSLVNLYNHGTVEYNCQGSGEQIVGGVVGEAQNALNTICNDGTVTSSGVKTSYLRIGGVIGHISSQVPSATNITSTSRARVAVENFTSTNQVGLTIAGLISYSSAGISITDCTNEGSVEVVNFTSTSSTTRLSMGGAIGFHSCTPDITLSNIRNTGHIYVEGPLSKSATTNIGNVSGLFGMINQLTISNDVSVTMTDCSNSGKVELNCGTAAKSKFVLASGIVSTINAKTFTMTDCTNSGAIDFNGYADTVYLGGLVARLGAGQSTAHERSVVITGAVNNGDITLTEPSTAANRAAAGGIVGVTASPLNFPMNIKMSSCTNNGDIDRRTTTIANRNSFAGGMFGAIGYSNATREATSGMLMGIGGTVENCTNNGMIRFNQVAGDSASDLGENSDGYTFTGGIAGLANAVCETGGITVKSCINKGNMWSTCGRHGGICGLVKGSVLITGTKDSYTRNEGLIIVRSAGAWNSGTSAAVLYSGGIVGQVQNEAARGTAGDKAVIEYCWNSGTVGGGVSAGGILGAAYSGDNYQTIVRYCKNNGLVQILKNKTSRGAFSIVGRFANVMQSVNDCAAGGKCLTNPKSGTGTPVTLTNDNWFKYVASGQNATIYTTAAEAQADNHLYWDGTSKTSWE